VASVIDEVGELHEKGGVRYGSRYPERPYMWPAVEATEERVPKHWSAVVGG
jgi:hypothetical protein